MSFSGGVSAWKKKVEAEMIRNKREIILRLFRAVIYDTPVLEGTLRANWRCSTGHSLAGAIAYRPVEQVISEISLVLGGAELADTVYLRNNLPYAYRVEYLGWSHTKAPQGMLRKNAARFSRIAKSNKL